MEILFDRNFMVLDSIHFFGYVREMPDNDLVGITSRNINWSKT